MKELVVKCHATVGEDFLGRFRMLTAACPISVPEGVLASTRSAERSVPAAEEHERITG